MIACTNCPDQKGRTCVQRTATRCVIFILVLTTLVITIQILT